MTISNNLKFRVWDNDEKRYRDDDVIDGSFLLSTEGILWSVEGIPWNRRNCKLYLADEERFVVEQCTGLEDKDGALIYEGDIIEMTRYVFIGDIKVERYAVEHSKMLARWRLGKSCIYLNTDTAAECKIVGNIHQNAEDSKR